MLREENHTDHEILKIKERIVNDDNSALINVPHLFTQNNKVNDFSERVHQTATGGKHTIKSQDSVIGATSSKLRDKIMRQLPADPKKTKQIVSNLRLAEGQRTEDGMTNGAGNEGTVNCIRTEDKPYGIMWVQFDHTDVGEKN